MKKLPWRLLLLCLLAPPVGCEQLFVRNKPFRGYSFGVGVSRLVELEPIAESLGLVVRPVNGGYLVVSDASSDQGSEICGPGLAIVNGITLTLTQGEGGRSMVSLSEFCSSVGARLVVQSECTDVYLESGARARIPSLKDQWGQSGPTRKHTPTDPAGPARVGVQVFDSYSLLPPIRDLLELRSFSVHQADLARFRSRLNELCSPPVAQQLYAPIALVAEKALEASRQLSDFPAEEFEAAMASKPELAESFLPNVAEWEAARNFSAEVVEEKSSGRSGQVTLLLTQVDPLSRKTSQRLVGLNLSRQANARWRVTSVRDLGPPKRKP